MKDSAKRVPVPTIWSRHQIHNESIFTYTIKYINLNYIYPIFVILFNYN